MSWFRDLRVNDEGRPIPQLFRTWSIDIETRKPKNVRWTVEYATGDHWECCGRTELEDFATWREAMYHVTFRQRVALGWPESEKSWLP